jgi:hypothetical protein
MLWLTRFTHRIVAQKPAALALALIAAAACNDGAPTALHKTATQRASRDNNPSNPFYSFSFSPVFVDAGGAATGTIVLVAPAPLGGARIQTTISRPDLASVDSVLVIPEGQTTISFLVQTRPNSVTTGTAITVTGNWGTCCWTSAGFNLMPGGTGGGGGIDVRSISLSPGSLTFGPQAPGTSSASQNVIVRNTGTLNLLLGITATGPFSISNNGCPITLYPGYSCLVSVAYAPTTGAGSQRGLLSVTSGAPTSPDTVALIGTPTPVINVTPTAISWGSVVLGNGTSGRVVKITNSGTASFSVSSLTLGGANPGDFPIYTDGCTGASLAPGTSCMSYVSFEPTRIGTRTATITIWHTAPGGPVTVSLSGTGAKSTGWVP